MRDRSLNPPEWVEWVDEPVPLPADAGEAGGYSKRLVPRDEAATKALKQRTLPNLSNVRPQWLADAHAALDAAVASAYGWEVEIAEEDVLQELLTLNQNEQSTRKYQA